LQSLRAGTYIDDDNQANQKCSFGCSLRAATGDPNCRLRSTIFSHGTQYIFDENSVYLSLLVTFMSGKTLLAIDKETVAVADYMKAQFPLMQSSGLPAAAVSHPKHWSLDFAIEVDHSLRVLCSAGKNQGADSE
jgi:hypothetical protein